MLALKEMFVGKLYKRANFQLTIVEKRSIANETAIMGVFSFTRFLPFNRITEEMQKNETNSPKE
jgi:hypothetical protein